MYEVEVLTIMAKKKRSEKEKLNTMKGTRRIRWLKNIEKQHVLILLVMITLVFSYSS